MKNRIIEIMKFEGLTPSKFADEIDVQRATISHITSGRNAPSSKVIAKILTRFPSINPDWLFSGTGQMNRNISKDSTFIPIATTSTTKTGSDLFANEPNTRKQEERKPEYRIDFTENTHTSFPKHIDKNDYVNREKVIPAKIIEKITIFYSDNTYETFLPEKKK